MKDYAKTIQQPKEPAQSSRSSLMGNDKNNNGRHDKQPQESGRGFFSILAIFILIAVLFAAYRQYTKHKALSQPTPQKTEAQTPKATSPQFDFYTVLPSGSTLGTENTATSTSSAPLPVTSPSNPSSAVPAQSSITTAVNPATAASTTTPAAPVQTINTSSPTTGAPASNPQFYLNAGDFASSADAQQMLSQLLLLGVQANIKTVPDNGASAYEILVGPYADEDAMNIVKSQLAAHQIEASVVQN